MKSYRSILTHLAMPTSGSSSSSGDEFQSLDQAAIEGLRILDPFQAERISRRGTAEGGGSSEGASGEREGSTEGVHVTEPEKQKVFVYFKTFITFFPLTMRHFGFRKRKADQPSRSVAVAKQRLPRNGDVVR
jgi:hypothetical protein